MPTLAAEAPVIEFQMPWVAALLPLPWLLRRLLPPAPGNAPGIYFPDTARLEGLNGGASGDLPRRARAGLLWLIWGLLLLAATGPRWLGEEVSLPASGRDLMLAVDISASMETADLELNGRPADRLRVVKSVAGEFLRRRDGDRVGLILFGSSAHLQAPLSFDRSTVGQLLEEAQIGFAGRNTAIGDALAIAVKRLRDRPEGSRVLVLMTDGANTAGEIPPREAADLAARSGLRVYTIGIGAESMELPGLLGGMFGARRINPSADLDEDTLRYIAQQGNGRYFRARDRQELEAIYAELDRLEPVEQDADARRPMSSLAHWPLAAAFVASAALALANLLARRIPATGAHP